MVTFTRNNAWNNQGTFNNTDLLWYARGVGEMQSRALDDENSWWFFAAIHGEYVSRSGFPGWGSIPGPPVVPTTPVPSQATQDKYWRQCQHQSWFFPPWHRGYLIALEAQIREAVTGLGGPADWSLPYWNYLGPGNQNMIPPAFIEQQLPDGTPNPLYVNARFGSQNNGKIFVVLPPVSGDCQNNDLYTGSNANTPSPGYGGPKTGFWHGGGSSGNLEGNPHNLVHVQVGGQQSGQLWGLMADPGLAALDPIFYLHHANIDRMWAAWNASGIANPTDPDWLQGPASIGNRDFVMPMPGGNPWVFKPADVDSLTQLDYDYEDLQAGFTPQLINAMAVRFNKLGVSATDKAWELPSDFETSSELVGASEKLLEIGPSGLKTAVKLDTRSWKNVPMSLMKVSEIDIPDQIYLQLENVKGTIDANILKVSVNDQEAGHVSLFGLRNASDQDGHHGGGGLTFTVNITDIIDNLHLEGSLDVNSFDVKVNTENEVFEDSKITVGRISLYREHQKKK